MHFPVRASSPLGSLPSEISVSRGPVMYRDLTVRSRQEMDALQAELARLRQSIHFPGQKESQAQASAAASSAHGRENWWGGVQMPYRALASPGPYVVSPVTQFTEDSVAAVLHPDAGAYNLLHRTTSPTQYAKLQSPAVSAFHALEQQLVAVLQKQDQMSMELEVSRFAESVLCYKWRPQLPVLLLGALSCAWLALSCASACRL